MFLNNNPLPSSFLTNISSLKLLKTQCVYPFYSLCLPQLAFSSLVLTSHWIDLDLYQPDVKVLPSSVAREEGSVILICNTTSSEPVNYIWFKDGTTVSSTNVLTIKNTTRNDAGNFSCSVRNALGKKHSSVISLSVMCKF